MLLTEIMLTNLIIFVEYLTNDKIFRIMVLFEIEIQTFQRVTNNEGRTQE